MYMSARPPPQNTLESCDREHVTVVRDDAGGVFCFVGYDPAALRVRWTERAPGSVSDPRGSHDYRGRDGLWRAFLESDFRLLLDRFDPSDLVAVVDGDVPEAT
jgi:hypothetical protein